MPAKFFQKKILQIDQLEPFGFLKVKDRFVYRTMILSGLFEMVVEIDEHQEVSAKLIDPDFKEAYTAFQAREANGVFVGKVRQAYEEVLLQIATQCFVECPFDSEQGNRMVEAISNHFGERLGNPFTKHPEIYACRHPDNQKWYALFQPVQKNRLQMKTPLIQKGKTSEMVVLVLNVKVDPSQLEFLLAREGVYLAYHMNKQHWVSVVLDDSVPDDVIWEMICDSRDLVSPKRASTPRLK